MLAGLLRAKGDLAGAERLCRQALAGWEKAVGPDHPGTLLVRGNLVTLLLALGRPADER